jgi:hypothetical protein
MWEEEGVRDDGQCKMEEGVRDVLEAMYDAR